jgi:hypothetical protein
MEPSEEMFAEVGRLCSAWAFLEARTEATVWGIVGADERLGRIITWRLDLRGRWQLILDHAPKHFDQGKCEVLRKINKDLVPVTRDRNIIVHGLIHAQGTVQGTMPKIGTSLATEELTFVRPPCWTVFRGAEAGKNFPISTKAVETVRSNVQKIAHKIREFNEQNGFQTPFRSGGVETEWPEPLE